MRKNKKIIFLIIIGLFILCCIICIKLSQGKMIDKTHNYNTEFKLFYYKDINDENYDNDLEKTEKILTEEEREKINNFVLRKTYRKLRDNEICNCALVLVATIEYDDFKINISQRGHDYFISKDDEYEITWKSDFKDYIKSVLENEVDWQ